jgi:hypothetical protein
MKLRLAGAFDRLQQYQRASLDPLTGTSELRHQLTTVIEACLFDLELKLKTLALSDDGTTSEFVLSQVRQLISRLTNSSLLVDVEELLPRLLAYVSEAKRMQGLHLLQEVSRRCEARLAKHALCELHGDYRQKTLVERALRACLTRRESKQTFGGLTRVFQSWKDELRCERVSETIRLFERYNQFLRETVTGQNVRRMSAFFDGCTSFISAAMLTKLPPSHQVDLIFVNHEGQPLTYPEGEGEERLIDMK